MRKHISWATLVLFAAVLGFWPAAAANAVVVTLQPGPTDGKDAEVRTASNQPYVADMNFGERETLQLRNTVLSSREYIPYIQFDVSSFTENVESAKFSVLSYLYNVRANPEVTREVGLYKVTSAWNEGDGGNPADPGEITYNTQPSFDPTPVATLTVKATITEDEETAGGVWHVWDSEDTGNSGLADLVEYWIDNPTLNYGMMIWFTGDPASTEGEPAHQYRSSDYLADASERPMLEISDTGGSPDPIPGDANLDDVVNDADASILAAHWQQTGMGWGDGDFNSDGDVNDADASILAAHWQETQEGAAPVPEPGTLVLLAGALLSLLVLRRR